MPVLFEKGTFGSSDVPHLDSGGDIKKFEDFRWNIGRNCFASNEATIKFFDRDLPDTLISYDLFPNEFEGLPGQWLALYDNNTFEAGERIDAGPVVFTGRCEQID